MADEPRGGRLAVHAGDRDDRDAGVIAFGEHQIDDRFAHGMRDAGRRFQMHSQARCGIDFDDHAVLFLQRPADVLRDHIDAGDVETDHLRGLHRPGGDLGMHVLGDVDGRAAGA